MNLGLNIYYKYAEALDSTSECLKGEISKKVTGLKRRDTSILDYQLFHNYETGQSPRWKDLCPPDTPVCCSTNHI